MEAGAGAVGEVSRRPPSPRGAGRGQGEGLFLAALGMTVLLACNSQVSRDRWQHMPPSEKTLYVKSLIGAEQVKHAKGGTGHEYTHPPEDYVKQIDAAYAHGDSRDPADIFAGLADHR
jgi:hypothetical protein